MKKNKFVSGLSARLALAVVALTAMFASCSNENIEIEVKPVPAKAVIYPVVIVDGADVTTQATITYSEGNGTYEAASIPAKAITVTASFDGLSDSKVVNIPALKAGQAWSQTVVFTMNHPVAPDVPEDYEVVVVTVSEPEITGTTDTKVYDNPSDYWFYVPVKYNQVTGIKVISSEVNSGNAELDAEIKDYITSQNIGYTTVEKTEEVPVMSHARLTAAVKTITTTTVYNIIAKTRAGENVLGSYTTAEINTLLETKGDAQIPGHGHAPAGHGHGYSHGHGHGHGNGNAGGGITFAD